MKPAEPDLLSNLRRELADARAWIDRAVVLALAAVAGLFVVGFTLLAEWAQHRFQAVYGWQPWLALVWTPAWVVGLVWLTQRFFPGAAGSGIPQVMVALEPSTPVAQRGLFVSFRLSCAKVVLTAGSLLAGLSVGREGPSVQVAAGVMLQARRWLSPRAGVDDHGLLVAGGAAGIAAAFNAPLAGVVFAVEQLSRSLDARNSGLILSAIVLAGLMGVSVFGNVTYFGVIHVPGLDWGLLGPGLLVVIGCGLLGGLLARLMVASAAGLPDRFTAWRRRYPLRFAAGCGLAVALIGLAGGGSTFGGGDETTRRMLAGEADVPPLYVLLKFLATWISSWTGVSGGVFAPALALGAGVGHDVAAWSGHPAAAALIAMGMAGFLAAVTQAPITAFIIVMEMVDGHAMVLSLMAVSLLSSLVARLLSRSLYDGMAELQALRLRPAGSPPAAADAAAAQQPAPADKA
ncbi:chloride channel protein [Caldimonas thermodepolymerans]|jgi:Chloride channel protein EriC|uniref:Chloride channel protein n=1 Tax=Caldimonas thermodepolymerans TaxID=215580 RepID=A0A2S5T545_9BURK|nr:chloride channel protein [Caldimonas thermodepolymerans]PPE70072.1 chloride channel protein [Caldimonas thermodepolymerans]QPC31817.1 chloride channel protein [Caldimonas thermodepolymerans]RDI01677.1 H+/Cl- antiporter ClcA [Caldimonas thermodepolymerans]TCP05814.1 H+/Cl- antiporter ClcA [Caldimonas thermodepolymerans]UZG44601.1 chloride channel protein [Caldimonas thermodepolymerans]